MEAVKFVELHKKVVLPTLIPLAAASYYNSPTITLFRDLYSWETLQDLAIIMASIPPVYIVSAVRTPIGSFLGWVSHSSAAWEVLTKAARFRASAQLNWVVLRSKVDINNCTSVAINQG